MPILLPVSHSLQNEVSTKSSEDCNGGISPPAMGCFTLLCSQILFFLILSTFFSPIFFYQIFGRLRWGDFSSTKSNGVLYTALLANTFLLPFFIPICQHFYSKCSFCNRPWECRIERIFLIWLELHSPHCNKLWHTFHFVSNALFTFVQGIEQKSLSS